MPAVFKVVVSGYRTPHGRKCKKHDAVTRGPDGKEVVRRGYKRIKKKSRNWYGQFVDAQGNTRRVPLCPDKAAAEQLLAKHITDVAMGKNGLIDRFAEHRSRPLA